MSNLTGNKIMGGLLATFLIVVGVPQIARIVFDKKPPAKPGMAVAVQEETAGGPAADNPPDWGTVLATADINAGKGSAAACLGCHNLDSGGPNMTGPNLFGVVGRKPGTHPGFAYSSSMVDFGGKNPAWTFDALYTFLKAPGRDVQGTKMTFPGFKDPQTRINVIAYLHTLGSSLPVPAPDPSRQAGAAPAAGAPAEGAAAAASDVGTAASGGKAAAPATSATPAPSTQKPSQGTPG